MREQIMPYDRQSNRLDRFCEGIIAKDASIRFVGLANQMGKLISEAYREGLQALMNRQETEHYTIQTVLRASTRETFEKKIGKQRYAIAVYEKLIRATIPVIMIGKVGEGKEEEEEDEKEKHQEEDLKWLYLLLVSFDLGSDVISIIEDKILPYIEKFGKDSLVA